MRISIKNIILGLFIIPLIALSINTIAQIDAFALVDCTKVNEESTTEAKKACPCNTNIKANITIAKGAECSKSASQSNELLGDNGIFKTITNTALYIIGALSVIMLIYGGIRYTVSMGDSKNVEAAKNTIMYAIIGIVVALLAYAIVNFVLTALITTA